MEKDDYCIAIDDDLNNLELIANYIGKTPGLKLYRAYSDPVLALHEISQMRDKQVKFIFLDIDMPVLSGTELVKSLRPKGEFLLFVTAHNNFAKEAYELKIDDYLLKPFPLSYFILKVNALRFPSAPAKEDVPKTAPLDKETQLKSLPSFFIGEIEDNGNKRDVKVEKADIAYIESKGNYIYLHLQSLKDPIQSYVMLNEINDLLKSNPNFIQVHKSFIVNTDQVTIHDKNSIRLLIHNSQVEVPIGKTYLNAFKTYMQQFKKKTGRR